MTRKNRQVRAERGTEEERERREGKEEERKVERWMVMMGRRSRGRGRGARVTRGAQEKDVGDDAARGRSEGVEPGEQKSRRGRWMGRGRKNLKARKDPSGKGKARPGSTHTLTALVIQITAGLSAMSMPMALANDCNARLPGERCESR